jgi:hypothetical protein
MRQLNGTRSSIPSSAQQIEVVRQNAIELDGILPKLPEAQSKTKEA